MSDIPSPVLELHEVSKIHPGTPPVASLRGVSLTVTAGELVAIVGPSGSGKTTLLNLAACLDRPTSGSIRLSGDPVERQSDAQLSATRAHRIGVVFQQFCLLDQFSARENVEMALLYRGAPNRVRRRAAMEALAQVGLGHRAGQFAGRLSGGERQRVAIARAVVGRPAVVLADEPTGNLDSRASGEILALLQRLNADGVTMIVVTHDPVVAGSMTRRVQLLDGKIIHDSGGTP